MRTNIVIDDELMASALRATGLATKKDVVEQGLKLLIKRDQLPLLFKDKDFTPFVKHLGLLPAPTET